MYSNHSSRRPILKEILDFSLLFAGYLYFVGWVYLYSYLNFFSLSIHQMNIELYATIIYSANVLFFLLKHWYYVLGATISYIFLVFIIKFIFKGISRTLQYSGLALLLIISLSLARYIGTYDARMQTDTHTTSLKTVEIIFKKDFMESLSPVKNSGLDSNYNNYVSGEKNAFLRNMQHMKMRLLMESNDAYYILHLDQSGAVPLVYRVRKEDVHLLDMH